LVTDTGTHAAAFGSVSSTRPPTASAHYIMREAAAGQDNATLCIDANKASLPFDHRAAHRAVLNNEFTDGGRQPQRNLQIERGFRKAAG